MSRKEINSNYRKHQKERHKTIEEELIQLRQNVLRLETQNEFLKNKIKYYQIIEIHSHNCYEGAILLKVVNFYEKLHEKSKANLEDTSNSQVNNKKIQKKSNRTKKKKNNMIDSHLKSDKHKNNVIRSENLTLSCQIILDTTNQLNEREHINIALVKAFTKANIPLEKVDKLKGGAIANSDQLRSKYLIKLYDGEVLKLQNFLQKKQISITIDETTDICNKSVVNILFSFNDKTILAKTEFITIVNSTSIAQLVMKVLQFYNIPFENLIFFISDNTAYMLKAFEIILLLIPQLRHNRCLAHVLNLVSKTWVHCRNFQFVSNIIKNIKISFVQSPAYKRRWVSFIKSYSNISTNQIILPPLPVKTRWNSWFRFVFWVNQNIVPLREFYLNEEQVNNENQTIQELVAIFKNNTNNFVFEIITIFISFNAIR
ncbi:540_t:CDS:2, partial [Gigaspora margarita]